MPKGTFPQKVCANMAPLQGLFQQIKSIVSIKKKIFLHFEHFCDQLSGSWKVCATKVSLAVDQEYLPQPQELPYVATFRFSESTLAYFYFISCYFPLIFSPPNKQTKKEKQSKLKKTGEKLKKIEGGRGNGALQTKLQTLAILFRLFFGPTVFF